MRHLIGAMLIMMLYNLFLFASIREKVYLYYVGWTGSLTLLQIVMQGYGQQYFWPDMPWAGSHIMRNCKSHIVPSNSSGVKQLTRGSFGSTVTE